VSAEVFDPIPVLEALADGGVDFVVIGGIAGGAHGSAYPTYDVDVMYSRDRENLERLAAVLRELGATLRNAPGDIPFLLDAKTLEAGGNFTFTTRYGPVDILAYAEGAPPYERVRAEAPTIDVGGRTVRVASLDHLIAMKEAAARNKDKLMATEYRELADEQRGQS
jgi:predicted nucleotidyltransferase